MSEPKSLITLHRYRQGSVNPPVYTHTQCTHSLHTHTLARMRDEAYRSLNAFGTEPNSVCGFYKPGIIFLGICLVCEHLDFSINEVRILIIHGLSTFTFSSLGHSERERKRDFSEDLHSGFCFFPRFFLFVFFVSPVCFRQPPADVDGMALRRALLPSISTFTTGAAEPVSKLESTQHLLYTEIIITASLHVFP